MAQLSDFVWFDGKIIPWDQAQVHVMTHTLHYGAGVFEGIRAYCCQKQGDSAIFRLEDHIRRLLDSTKIINLSIKYSKAELVNACVDILKANKMAEGYIRPIVFIGCGESVGVYPGENPVHVAIAAWPWGAYLGAEALAKGIRVCTSSFTRHHVNAVMTKAKSCGGYINSVLAKVEAKSDGYDEALLLDTEGYVCEASGENIFIVRDKVIKTPAMTAILGGITRDSVIRLARDLGYTVIENRFSRDELYVADEAFFTGTAAEITPIREVDNRAIGAGKPGEVALHLQKEFFAIVKGENPAYDSWLHHYKLD